MKLLRVHITLVPLVLLAACAGSPAPAPRSKAPAAAPPLKVVAETVRDPHSFARPDEVAVEHLVLDLAVDFGQRQLTGRASLRLHNKTGADRVVLDTRDLEIRRVTLDDGKTEARYKLGDEVKLLGRPLEVEIAPTTRWVNIDYATKPAAAALQWLTPEQAGSSYPFLYTQSESILARTWVPCQDTPGVRMTYEATIHAPRELMAVMSAENPAQKSADGI